MIIKTKHIGAYGNMPASIIELIIENDNGNYILTETITRFSDDKVDEEFINTLRNLVDELEEHNNKLNKYD